MWLRLLLGLIGKHTYGACIGNTHAEISAALPLRHRASLPAGLLGAGEWRPSTTSMSPVLQFFVFYTSVGMSGSLSPELRSNLRRFIY